MPPPPSLCRLGEQFTHLHLLQELDAFTASGVFARRPVRSTNKFNHGGTGFFHAFYLWAVVRSIAPLHIVESGAFDGLGTWMLRQAAPNAQITVISPAMPKLWVDAHPDTRYFTGKAFLDFNAVQWDCLGMDKARTLIFFDDHQSGYRRMLEAHARGFQHLTFDDNYLPGGDNFSPKAACAASELAAHLGAGKTMRFADNPFAKGRPRVYVDAAQLEQIRQSFGRLASRYEEMPPLWPGPNRHKLNASGVARTVQPPLLAAGAERERVYRVPSLKGALRGAAAESEAYTFFSYVRLNGSAAMASLFVPPGIDSPLPAVTSRACAGHVTGRAQRTAARGPAAKPHGGPGVRRGAAAMAEAIAKPPRKGKTLSALTAVSGVWRRPLRGARAGSVEDEA